MYSPIKIIAFIITFLFCAKTFFMAFFALNQYPRCSLLQTQISVYANPTTYLWITFITNIIALFAGFWMLAGLCENLFAFFSPAFTVIISFLIEDLVMHGILVFITNVFHMLMIFNTTSTIIFGIGMLFVYRSTKEFEDINPEQVLSQARRFSV
ncbi:uncharacterized protein LOC105665268 [Ceratitis capitata]|uniref:uncharacterized protein LOC105665268 n=1 Tax=Ceratitis capitata TaxID=7213 RepID=UPI0006187E67|nr:uncharacterized protein LOC105665268 [Ceratitis capitata]